MTDADSITTSKQLKRPLLKQLARDLLVVQPVNRLVVGALARMPHADWKQRIPVIGRQAVLDLGRDRSISLGHPDKCQISMQVFWRGGQLSAGADRLALEAALTLSRTAKTFLDIGSYTGLFALAVARTQPSIRSFAYEIVPENFLILYENVIENDLIERVVPRLCGLSSEAGSLTVPAGIGLGLLASSIALDTRFDRGTHIPLETLDQMHASDEGPFVLKLDVEGFELEILEGGQRLLEQTRPDMVCEVLRRAKRTREMQELLSDLGYRFFHITDEGYVERREIVADKAARDWLFTTRDADELQRCGLGRIRSS
ncbi:MAG: FkbM family methyltransferase [Acidobacteriota bacterium]